MAADDVEVLLATFAGERFLREQMESVLGQEGVGVRVLARDDGSTDGTVEILEEYAARFPKRVSLLKDGERSGGAQWNFARLMAASTAEYVCFCDQDDVWLPGKVSASMGAMRTLEAEHGAGAPLLVVTDLRVVDAKLGTMAESYWKQQNVHGDDAGRVEKMLVSNAATGCTMLMNRRLVELAREIPEAAPMHDRWVALVAAACGFVGLVNEATVLYRQHGGNVVGAGEQEESVAAVLARARQAGGRVREMRANVALALALLRLHGAQMPVERRRVVEEFVAASTAKSRWTRVAGTVRGGFLRRGWLRKAATLVELFRGPVVS